MKKRCLFCEDEEGARIVFARAMVISQKVFGANVELDFCDHISVMRRMVQEKEYDALILDLTLIDSTREQTMAELPALQPICPPIFVLTGSTEIGLRDRCLMLGAEEFAVKEHVQEAMVTFFERVYNMCVKRARDKALGKYP